MFGFRPRGLLTFLLLSLIPHVIKGDFDSIRPEVRKYYETAGSQVIHDSNQDTTDLQKALSAVNLSARRDDRIRDALLVIVGGLGGNISQELSNFNCMFDLPDRRMCFVGDTNIVMMLHPGSHRIMAPIGVKCGLIPLGNPVHQVRTSGLKWNLSTHFSDLLTTPYRFLIDYFSPPFFLVQTETRSSLVVL